MKVSEDNLKRQLVEAVDRMSEKELRELLNFIAQIQKEADKEEEK